MRELRAPEVQKTINALVRQQHSIESEIAERYQEELTRRTAPIQKMLHKLYSENPVVSVVLTPLEQIELEEAKNE